jgi:hypothetical protein
MELESFIPSRLDFCAGEGCVRKLGAIKEVGGSKMIVTLGIVCIDTLRLDRNGDSGIEEVCVVFVEGAYESLERAFNSGYKHVLDGELYA